MNEREIYMDEREERTRGKKYMNKREERKEKK